MTVTSPVRPRRALRIPLEALRCPAGGQRLHRDGTALVADDGSRRDAVAGHRGLVGSVATGRELEAPNG